MATFVPFDGFTGDCLRGRHNFASDTIRLLLTNNAPNASDDEKADLTEISPGNGYTANGPTVAATLATGSTAAKTKVTLADTTITASGGSIATFRYGVIYNDTSTGDKLIGYIDNGSSVSLADGQSFQFNFNDSSGAFEI